MNSAFAHGGALVVVVYNCLNVYILVFLFQIPQYSSFTDMADKTLEGRTISTLLHYFSIA